MEPTDIVAPEVAEAEFVRFVEAMDLDIEPTGMDEEDLKSFEQCKRKVVRAIQVGTLVIDEKGQPVFTPTVGNSSPITFKEPTGQALSAMDSRRKGHDVGKLFASMAAATWQPTKRFETMANRDLKVCTAIITLFLG